jgi:hypothetical protein
MSDCCNKYDEIKRKLRKLKKMEIRIRFSNSFDYSEHNEALFAKPHNATLVWDEFFDLHEACTGNAKYSIIELAEMNKDEFKNVVSEFFFYIYYRFYKENGIVNVNLYDPDLLTQMGLPIDADSTAVKKKFRELAKKYHPDTGGDSAKFIELMENYKKLID